MEGILVSKGYKEFHLAGTEIRWEGAEATVPALPGDTVRWDGSRCTVMRRANHTRIVGTIELNGTTLHGMTSRGVPIYRFQPMDSSYPLFFVGCSEKDRSKPLLARVRFESWEPNSICPRGTMDCKIGCAGDREAEEAALLWHYAPERLKKAPGWTLSIPSFEGRFRIPGPTIHIDPPGCKDVDDAISLYHGTEEGSWILVVTIADVSAWMDENPILWEQTARFGQTFYSQEGKVLRPMLDSVYSEEECTLLPGKDRLGVSLFLEWSKGTFTKSYFQPTVLSVQKSHTYESILKEKEFPVGKLREIVSCLAQRTLDDPHDWVATLMIHYNSAVATLLHEKGVGILRRHSAAKQEELDRMNRLGLPVELAFHSAENCLPTEEDLQHWGLGKQFYGYATSPIRRYVDCVNQKALKEILEGRSGSSSSVELVQQLNAIEKAARHFDRDCLWMRCLLRGSGSLSCIHLGDGKFYCAEWRHTLRYRGEVSCAEGDRVSLEFFANPLGRNWKERLVLRVGSTQN